MHMTVTQMLPPPPAEEDLEVLSEDGDLEVPPGYRLMKCPSCEELHLRPGNVRTEPLRDTPRTDTIPIRGKR